MTRMGAVARLELGDRSYLPTPARDAQVLQGARGAVKGGDVDAG